LNISAINTVSGLGYTFQNDNFLSKVIKVLFKNALKHSSKVFFQNGDDLNTFLKYGLVDAKKTDLVAGSGVNLQKFQPKSTFNPLSTQLTFLFSARLLRDKGIIEYMDAARAVKKIYPMTKFWILGITFANPMAVSLEEVLEYEKEGVIEYKGKTDNMAAFLEEVDVVVLPSYHEGMPRMLLEAMAKSLPIITTNAVGCRETVEDGVNGFMVPIKDAAKLEKAMLQLIQLNTNNRRMMGEAGLKQAQTRFDENIVINAYVNALEQYIV
jgi:glycosyltransferase involved in cell wall biosynthesis